MPKRRRKIYDMEMSPTSACKHLKLSYRILYYKLLNLPDAHVSATLVAILREVTYRGYITETSRTNAQI
jgi:hypothetical protein